jgi:septum formation topological specificity factor MinE
MKKLTRAQLFAPPKTARKTKSRLARAKLVLVAARERAHETAQQHVVPSMKRPPTVLQRRRLARVAVGVSA